MRRIAVAWLVILVLILAGTALHFRQIAGEQGARLEESLRQVESLRHEALSGRIPPPDWKAIGREMKVEEPEAALREDLMSRTELIPWEGVLGGRMAIPDPDSIWFFAPNWALVYVEDGHIAGYMLLRFGIKSGKPFWKLVDSEAL